MPGGSSRSNSQDLRSAQNSPAWILGAEHMDYNTALLTSGEKVPELWNDNGNVLVFLFSKESGRGPSFKVQQAAVEYSAMFSHMIQSDLDMSMSSGTHGRNFTGRQSLSAADARTMFMPQQLPNTNGDELRLYIPTTMHQQQQQHGQHHGRGGGHHALADVERLVSIRNLFALLTGQPLVGTQEQRSHFVALMRVAALLPEFGFTNEDGTTFGDAFAVSFDYLIEQLQLADVRHSREKTLEALVLGERMKSWDLYNEAFAHAVGKYSAIRSMNSPLWNEVSSQTRTRLEQAQLELANRQSNVNNRLESFDFPALFSGVASSTALTEYRNVRFSLWRKSFARMRQFVLGYYKAEMGNWPPKARSKKNEFTESGLNRMVLKILFNDFCALYELIADRTSLTSRSIDHDADDDESNPTISALRKILSEFDRSSPPVLPPIPFDIPKIPDMTSVKENYYNLPQKEQNRMDKNLQEYELLLVLNKAYDFNFDRELRGQSRFLNEFKHFERKEAGGRPLSDIADQRIGYWLFLYVVIQSLPMLIMDAPGLKHTEQVEYFLCQPPKGHPPWMANLPAVRKRWYEVNGGAGYVELNMDAVEFSIEGTYHRSHCWQIAKQWEAGQVDVHTAVAPEMSPLPTPQAVFEDMDLRTAVNPVKAPRSVSPTGPPQLAIRTNVSRNISPANRNGSRSSLVFGLEPVAVPPPHQIDPRDSRAFSAMPGGSGHQAYSQGVSSAAPVPKSQSWTNLQHSLHAAGPASASPVPTPDHGRRPSRQEPQGGSTFDDILKTMDTKPKKKKTMFFG
jgi:hypothetical protein